MISKSQLQRAMGGLQQAKPRPYALRFNGGADFETPPLSKLPGFVRSALNYEQDVLGGYTRVMGYERSDGHTSPSDGVAYVLDITLTGTLAVGNTVTGGTSAATGVVIALPDSVSVVITKITGTFQSGETLKVAGVAQATTTSTRYRATTALLRAQYKNLAADVYRADIAVPTGSGGVLGVFRFGGYTYQFRNNAGGTAANLWKSSAAGWTQVTLHKEIAFTAGGATEPAEGTTLTQGGVTATIKRVVRTSGSWAANTAAGRLIITTPAGGNFAGGAATDGAINFTLTAIQTAIVILPTGRYECKVDNFSGGSSTKRVYGCDCVNRGFEFADDIYVPITTGMTTDAPTHVECHKKQLFYFFASSVQHSAPGFPYVWSAVLGASEIAVGDNGTGFQSQPGGSSGVGTVATGAMTIFCRNLTYTLYGSGVSDWNLVPYRRELGAYAYSIQDVGYTLFLDDRGVTTLRTAQEFGNFTHSAITTRVRTWLNSRRSTITESCVSRDKSQYRVFFSDGYALFITVSGKQPAIMVVRFPKVVSCAFSSEESDGTESIFFGSTDGMVYQMEKGTSFDGDAIVSNINLTWDFLGSPQLIKRFHSAALEVAGTGYSSFSFTYKLGYGSTSIAQPSSDTAVADLDPDEEVTSFSYAQWDSMTWDDFVWDGQTLMPSQVDMGGEGENLSIIIRGNSDYHEAVRYSGALIMWAPRRYIQQ
jgi:hypothetical protein